MNGALSRKYSNLIKKKTPKPKVEEVAVEKDKESFKAIFTSMKKSMVVQEVSPI